MRTVAMAMAGLLLLAKAGHAECVFHNDYYSPELSGACTVEDYVPEGCPLHVATVAGDMPGFVVARDSQSLMLPSNLQLVDTLTVPMQRVDPNDCNCSFVDSAASFDRYEVSITGAVEGDVVSFKSGSLNGSTWITIGPPGACPAAAWPTDYVIATRCDRCIGGGDSLDADEAGSGGCATTDGHSPLLVLLVGLAIVLRRRTTQGTSSIQSRFM
jgi:MYXO-CTERM domain-containing protein